MCYDSVTISCNDFGVWETKRVVTREFITLAASLNQDEMTFNPNKLVEFVMVMLCSLGINYFAFLQSPSFRKVCFKTV